MINHSILNFYPILNDVFHHIARRCQPVTTVTAPLVVSTEPCSTVTVPAASIRKVESEVIWQPASL